MLERPRGFGGAKDRFQVSCAVGILIPLTKFKNDVQYQVQRKENL